MNRAFVSRADLVRAMAIPDERPVSYLANYLGMVKTTTSKSTSGTEPIHPTALSREPIQESVLTWPQDQARAQFWQPVTYRLREIESLDRRLLRPTIPSNRDAYNRWRNRPEHGPEFRPIAPWSQLIPKLHAGLKRNGRTTRIDEVKLTRLVAEQKMLRRFPRRPTRRWGSEVLVIVDYSERLVPFRADQDLVCHALQRMLPENGFRIATVSDPELEFSEWSTGVEQTMHLPDARSVILILSDLGVLDLRHDEKTTEKWLAWATQAKENGNHLLALVPCSEALMADSLRRMISVHTWQRKGEDRNIDTPELGKRAEELLMYISPATRVEPGLIRSMRDIDPRWSNLELESFVWQNPAIQYRHPAAASFAPESAKELLSHFERCSDCCKKKQALELIRKWHSCLHHSVWFDEICRLSKASRELVPADDEKDALAHLRYYHEKLKQSGSVNESAMAFLNRSVDRQSEAGWYDEEIGPMYRFVSQFTHPEVDLPSGIASQPSEIPSGQSIQTLCIRQKGNHLDFESDQNADVSQMGSLCSSVTSTLPWLVLEPAADGSTLREKVRKRFAPEKNTARVVVKWKRDARCETPHWNEARIVTDYETIDFKRIEKPDWASAIGRDLYGLWVDFMVSHENQSLIQRMRWIPPGRFMMGSDDPDDSGFFAAAPKHAVVSTIGFWIFDTPATQALWNAVMGNNPSEFRGKRRPVERVSWSDCHEFCAELSKQCKLRFSLPTEAQWERACRAGTQNAFGLGDNLDPSTARVSASETCDVASFACNEWGLFDMHGNVWEWCEDGVRDYAAHLTIDPVGPADEAGQRVVRGGGWNDSPRSARSAYRFAGEPDYRDAYIGFRCVARQDSTSSRQSGVDMPTTRSAAD